MIWNRLAICMCVCSRMNKSRKDQGGEGARDKMKETVKLLQSHKPPKAKQSTNHDHWSSHPCIAHQLFFFSIQVDCFLFSWLFVVVCALDKCAGSFTLMVRSSQTENQWTFKHMRMKQHCAWFTLDASLKFITQNKCYHAVSHSFRFLHVQTTHVCWVCVASRYDYELGFLWLAVRG